MDALSALLKEELARGPMPVARFMELCLYHPVHGYYTRGVNFTDAANLKGRDFTTAPELTPLFGHVLAEWVANEWQARVRPTPFTLAEAGPGRGACMRDMLAHLKAHHATCFAAARPWLVETSPALVEMQKHTLAGLACTWACKLEQLPETPTLLVANELLDAFPIRQFCGEAQRMVVAEGETLAFSCEEVTREDSPARDAWLEELKALPACSALLIDYGYTQGGGDSLQALHRHQPVDVFHLPGESDLTAHVDFARVRNVLGNSELHDLGPFLMENGLLALAEATINEAETASAIQRLLHPDAMGSLFKVLVYRTK